MRRRKITWLVGVIVLVVAIALAALLGYQWTQSRYYVGASPTGNVAIFQGVQQSLGPISLSHVYEESSITGRRACPPTTSSSSSRPSTPTR